jgi:hypothetical protein
MIGCGIQSHSFDSIQFSLISFINDSIQLNLQIVIVAMEKRK